MAPATQLNCDTGHPARLQKFTSGSRHVYSGLANKISDLPTLVARTIDEVRFCVLFLISSILQ